MTGKTVPQLGDGPGYCCPTKARNAAMIFFFQKAIAYIIDQIKAAIGGAPINGDKRRGSVHFFSVQQKKNAGQRTLVLQQRSKGRSYAFK
jgi:hypothetical protein